MTLRRYFLALAACFCCTPGVCSAQVDSASATLSVAVRDKDRIRIAGAQVTILNEDKGYRRNVVLAGDDFLLQGIPPGSYRVDVEAKGFAKREVKIDLNVGQSEECDVVLDVEGASTTIEVQADRTPLHGGQTKQANIIGEDEVKSFPNTSRSFVESIYTLPGVANSYTPTLQEPGVGTAYLSSGFSIGASNGRSNLVTIDGGEDDYGSGTMRDMHVPIDSIQEFQVNRSSFEAQFGFTSGTAINMVTRTGTNQFRGTVAGYFHDQTTDGGNYFDKLAAGGPKPFEQSAIFSATAGGPILRNRLFFFTAPEYQRLDSATVQNLAAEEEFQSISTQSNGYAGRSCPNQNTQQVTQLCYLTQMADSGGPLAEFGAALLAAPIFGNPLADPILHALVKPEDGTFDGIPASPVGSGVRGLPGFSTPRGRYFNWVTRVDGTHSNNTYGLRFALMHEDDTVAPRPPYSGDESQSDYTLTGSWTRNGNRFTNFMVVQVVPSDTAYIQAPSPNGSEIDLGNQIQLGTPFSYPYDAHFKRFQFDDSLSWVAGTHLLKIGGSWRPDYYSVKQKLWFGGNWKFTDGTFSIFNLTPDQIKPALTTYNLSEGYPEQGPPSTNLTAVQAFLAGTPTLLLQADPDSDDHWADWTHLVGLFAQDTWKARPTLTLDFGLRADFDDEPAPVPGAIRISPRVGVAWAPGGSQKTVIRAGGGVFVAPYVFMIPFYANILGVSGKYVNQNALVASPDSPRIFEAWDLQRSGASPAVPNPPLNNGQLRNLGITIGPPGPAAYGNFIYTMAHGFEPAYTIQASLSLAREVSNHLWLEAAYLMYHAVHVEQVLETNFVQDTSSPVDRFTGPQYISRPGSTVGEPNSSIFQNNTFSSVGSGLYQGGTVSLHQELNHGLQFRANYTFSRAVDDTSDFSSISTPFRPDQLRRDYSLSDFNVTHSFVASGIYNSQLNSTHRAAVRWAFSDVTVSPIITVRSGIPFTLLVPGMSNGTIGHNANARPWQEKRNEGLGAAFVSWDLRLSKMIRSKEDGGYLEFIAQTQNLLNHTNFAAVNNNFPVNPEFALPGGGTLAKGPYHVKGFAPTKVPQLSEPLSFTASYPARQISLGLRLTF